MKDVLKGTLNFTDEQIEELVKNIGLRSAKSLENKVDFLCNEYNIQPKNIKNMMNRTTVFLTYSQETIKQKYLFFSGQFGFSKEEFGRLLIRQPRVVTYSTQNITHKMKIYGKALHLSPKDAKRLIISCPSVLSTKPIANMKKIVFLHKIGVSNKAILKKPAILCLPANKISERMALCESMGLNKRQYVTTGCILMDERRVYARARISKELDYRVLSLPKKNYEKETGIDEKLIMELCEYIPELQEYYANYYKNMGIDIEDDKLIKEKMPDLYEKEAE